MGKVKRIAMLGFRLESNSHAPICMADDFIVIRGAELADDLNRDHPRSPTECSAFMDALADEPELQVIPISVAMGGAAGPVEQAFFDSWLEDALQRTRSMAPIDGIYLAQHGAAIATHSEDPDGDMIEAFRRHFGVDIPMVVTLDPHANVSLKMTENSDFIVAYQTNPHVDQYPRGKEAGNAMRELLGGVKTSIEWVKLPMIPPSIAQNTDNGPLGEHIAYGQSFLDQDIMAVCVCSGFSVADTCKNGMSVSVTTRGDRAPGVCAAQSIAQRIWDDRSRYDITLTSLEDATQMMLAVNADSNRESLCFADVADNPGGGGRGNTTYILRAFLDAGCENVLLGPFFDPLVARQAHRLGIGAQFDATFNSEETSEFSQALSCKVKVLALHDGVIVGRRGILAGRSGSMGATALLQSNGMYILVVTRRVQFCDPAMIECVGISLDQLRGLVVKSRGHFRASVDEVFSDERIIEIDVPGLTTPMLERIDWQRVPRPIYPLDRSMDWSASV